MPFSFRDPRSEFRFVFPARLVFLAIFAFPAFLF
jgi:hypothetical protein